MIRSEVFQRFTPKNGTHPQAHYIALPKFVFEHRKESTMMTNQELDASIQTTGCNVIASTSCKSYDTHLDHLKALQAEQLRRAVGRGEERPSRDIEYWQFANQITDIVGFQASGVPWLETTVQTVKKLKDRHDALSDAEAQNVNLREALRRQEYEFRGKKCWNEVRLTLIWIGQIEAAWMHSERNNHTRVNWSEPTETVAWYLGDRTWRKLEKEVC